MLQQLSKRHDVIIILALQFCFYACTKPSGEEAKNAVKLTNERVVAMAYPPVETLPPNAPSQKPAFSGQTRSPGAKTQTPLNVTILARTLNHPWSIAFLPDGRMLVTEKSGNMRIITTTGVVSNPLLNLPAVKYQAEAGLLDVITDDNFSTNRQLFWTYVEASGTKYTVAVAKANLSADETKLDNVKVIYRATPSYTGLQHFGARLLLYQGLLHVCLGDRHDDSIRVQAQQLNSSIGKVIRINKDGTPAAGNPYKTTSTTKGEIWSIGSRDPQGMVINPATGELWESEHGPTGGDEINIIKRGANYGWPVITYGLDNDGSPLNGGKTAQDNMRQPVYYWDPAIAPSGMTFYPGTAIAEWQNNLFVASLKNKHIVRLIINNNRVTGEERLLTEQNQRFRDVKAGPDGALYAVTDELQGRLYRISKK